MRASGFLGALLAVVALAGCGGSGATVPIPTVPPARTFTLAGFNPMRTVAPGMMGNRVWLRLLASCLALACGVAAVVVAILLVRGVVS